MILKKKRSQGSDAFNAQLLSLRAMVVSKKGSDGWMQCVPLENLFHPWQGMWGDITFWPVLFLRYRLNPRRSQVLDQKLGCDWPTWYEGQQGAGGERKLFLLTSSGFLSQHTWACSSWRVPRLSKGRGCGSHVRQHWRWAEEGGTDRSWGQPLVCATNPARQEHSCHPSLLTVPGPQQLL